MEVDYLTLNAWTVVNRHPLLYIDDLLNSLHGCTHFANIVSLYGYY